MLYFNVFFGGKEVIDVDFNFSMFGYISIVKFIMEFIVYFERFVFFVMNCIGFIWIGMV